MDRSIMEWSSPIFVPQSAVSLQEGLNGFEVFQRHSPVQRSPPKLIAVIDVKRQIPSRSCKDGRLSWRRGVLLEEFGKSLVIGANYCAMQLGHPFADSRLGFQRA